MKVMMILPELVEGGVERHVLDLSNHLCTMGHRVWVVSAGGSLEDRLSPDVEVLHLPVHLKNPATALYSAVRIARIASNNRLDVIHTHSRVPNWIGWWASRMSRVPLVITAHSCYRRNVALLPINRADGVICVSESVREHLGELLPVRSAVIFNGMEEPSVTWVGDPGGIPSFLFVGRITQSKGLGVLLEALGGVDGDWRLDVVGDGPQRHQMEALSCRLGLSNRVTFHGFRDDVDLWMSRCSCFVFPSLEEGMGRTLMRAVQIGTPVMASNLPAVRELALDPSELVPAGDPGAWRFALAGFLRGERPSARFDPGRIPSVQTMALRVLDVYRGVLA
jgi:glycosyltransferase involved in cell wall biosynthesis